jgi:hypothetical protein
MLRFALTLAMLATLVVAPGVASAQAGCQFRGGFAQLQALFGTVGTCRGGDDRPDGQSTQRTSGVILKASIAR